MRTIIDTRAVMVIAASCALCWMSAPAAAQTTARQDPTSVSPTESKPYEVITKGLLGSPVYPVQFKSAALRLDIRNLIVGPGTAQGIPIKERTLMELRGGGVVTTIDGQKQTRRAGDFWVVERGSALSIENAGDVAVIRAMEMVEGAK